jgi:phosphoribosylanthranilate isomerase
MSVKVKICGITRAVDAQFAALLGATALGFIFWPGSPRYIPPERARAIVAGLPDGVVPVGVFVNQPVGDVYGITRRTGLGAVQLHGSEDPRAFAGLGVQIIKAVAVGEGFDPSSVATIPTDVTVLLDARDPVKHGGTGRTIDWNVAARVAAERPVVLSGGLTSLNIRAAVAAVRPQMVDLSSGVESAPGVKDHERLRAVFREL